VKVYPGGEGIPATFVESEESCTDNNLVFWDPRPSEATGSKVQELRDLVSMTINGELNILGKKSIV
jgi:hypothetical protein